MELNQTRTTEQRSQNLSGIQVLEVETKAQLKKFIELPRSIYTDHNSPYVMPLELHVKMMMGKLGTPQKHFLLALKNGTPVARLGLRVHKYHDTDRLHFGFFECQPKHPEAAQALFEKAAQMYPELSFMGPFHFRQEDPYVGILVEGFQYEPYFLMPYNPPEYDQMLAKAGFTTAMDLFTYDIESADVLPASIIEKGEEARTKHGITVRFLDPKDLWKEARTIGGIFNDALKGNWGYEEFTDDQVKEMVQLLKLFIDPRVVAFAQKDGKDIGCLIMIPNYNPVIRPSRGKLGLGLFWRFFRGKKSMEGIRGYALGVLKPYHKMGIGSFLTAEMFKAGPKAGYKRCEISWILANNGPMNELSKAMGGKQNKVYRIYEKGALKKPQIQ